MKNSALTLYKSAWVYNFVQVYFWLYAGVLVEIRCEKL